MAHQGDSLAPFANRAFAQLLRQPPTRKQLTEYQHRIILGKDFACNLGCATRAQTHADHDAPRYAGGEDGFGSLQIICARVLSRLQDRDRGIVFR